MHPFAAVGFLVIYLVSILLAVSTTRNKTKRPQAFFALSAPYVVATAFAFLSPVPNTVDDVLRALSFALIYGILTAILVYSVKKQWERSPD